MSKPSTRAEDMKYTVQMAARRTGLSEAAIRDRLRRGTLPHDVTNGRITISESQLARLEQLVTTRRVTAEEAFENLTRRKA